jgi:oligopeptidase B
MSQQRGFAAATSNGATTSSSLFSTGCLVESNDKKNGHKGGPPVARRDENMVYYCGAAPPPGCWNDLPVDLPRQSQNSKASPLVDPPVAIANPYGWMRRRSRKNDDDDGEDSISREVLDHLQAENNYTNDMTLHLHDLRQQLYHDMLSYMQETDYTTPRPHGPFYYYTRTVQGKSYTVHCRAPRRPDFDGSSSSSSVQVVEWNGSADAPILPGEQVVLDVSVLAQGQDYCSTSTILHSPSHKLVAYTVDFKGDEVCSLFVKNIETPGQVPKLICERVYGTFCWGNTDHDIFYMKMDALHRPFRLYRRDLNQHDDTKDDELLFEESDQRFWMGIYKSLDDKYLFLALESKETSEIHYLDLQQQQRRDDDDSCSTPPSTLQCIAKRRPKVLYEADYRQGRWWICSNVGGRPNMALFTAPAVPNCQDSWQLVVVDAAENENKAVFDGSHDRALSQITCFAKHVVAYGRKAGLPRLWILSLPENESIIDEGPVKIPKVERVAFEEDAYFASMDTHYEYGADTITVVYESMVTPPESVEISMQDTSKRTAVKKRTVPGYDRSMYSCERITVTSRDGETQIPVSLVYRKDVMNQHLATGDPVHLHLYGYGSYGSCTDSDFRATRLPLLDRGMVYALAHVRGGGEMGRQWYEEPNGGKYLCKKNTFNDFVDIAKWLINERQLTHPDKLSCEGRSAGGLLVGASLNQAPELFRAAILGVPFVDVACTMMDASIPLTVVEWEEIGNPSEVKYHKYMLEYSPMENVQYAKYPACLLTGGLHDPR